MNSRLLLSLCCLANCKHKDMDVAELLALITFAGINFDKEELFKSKITKKTFEDETFCECLQNLLANKVQLVNIS
jgi:hypothetical protein